MSLGRARGDTARNRDKGWGSGAGQPQKKRVEGGIRTRCRQVSGLAGGPRRGPRFLGGVCDQKGGAQQTFSWGSCKAGDTALLGANRYRLFRSRTWRLALQSVDPAVVSRWGASERGYGKSVAENGLDTIWTLLGEELESVFVIRIGLYSKPILFGQKKHQINNISKTLLISMH